jgi:hypothetical protein
VPALSTGAAAVYAATAANSTLCVPGDALIIRSTGGPTSAVQAAMHLACLVGERLHVLSVQLVDVGRE